MTLAYQDRWLDIHGGDCRDVLATLPAKSVHCVVTSPPYWGLRDYGTATWEGGDPDCDHLGPPKVTQAGFNERYTGRAPVVSDKQSETRVPFRDVCGKCGARRLDAQLGLEDTPEEYVATLVDVFRAVRRVLRDDGTVWLNLGDSYAGSWGANGRGEGTNAPRADLEAKHGTDAPNRNVPGLKPKDLCMIPARVAIALQADGWYLRMDVIWNKPNGMPESVDDRPTKSHEYVFILAKRERYYWDADAVREAATTPQRRLTPAGYGRKGVDGRADNSGVMSLRDAPERELAARNIRSVWTIATASYPGAHFATFPPKLVEPCVKAGTSERGVCPECGAPWERVVERTKKGIRHVSPKDYNPHRNDGPDTPTSGLHSEYFTVTVRTTGWRPTCRHDAEPVPAVVLDPFAGTGTVGLVAQQLGRRAVLIDLNPEYLRQCIARTSREFGVGGKVYQDRPAEDPDGSLWADMLAQGAPGGTQ